MPRDELSEQRRVLTMRHDVATDALASEADEIAAPHVRSSEI